jgi:hypothetical protein
MTTAFKRVVVVLLLIHGFSLTLFFNHLLAVVGRTLPEYYSAALWGYVFGAAAVAVLSWVCAALVGWGVAVPASAQTAAPVPLWVRRALWLWGAAAAVWWGTDVALGVVQANSNNAAWAHTLAGWWWAAAWLGVAAVLMAWLWRTGRA